MFFGGYMAFKKSTEPISYTIKENGVQELIEEKNNMTLFLQEVGWNGNEAKLELRKWIVKEKDLTTHKGVSFMTIEGPTNLANALVKNGYGDTETILDHLKNREDFETALTKVIGKKNVVKAKNTKVDINEDEYFDPNEMFT